MNILLERDARTADLVRDFYDRYYDTLDSDFYEAWPEFFAAECRYRIISRENFEAGLPLSTILAESRDMLHDRVVGLRTTQVYAPRYCRRFPGPLRVRYLDDGVIDCEHNLMIVQTLIDQQPQIILVGRCRDMLILDSGLPLLRQRDVIFDSEMVANSLICLA